MLSWGGLLVAGHAPLDALFEVTSAASTVGLSTGITGPGLDALSKGILSVDMLMGRVEILALVLLLFPATWIGRRRTD